MGRRAKTPYIQLTINDRFLNLSDRARKAIVNSRLGHFGDHVFAQIPYQEFTAIYSANGRGPSNLLYNIAAYLIMVQENYTVDELILNIDSDIAVQYALHTTSMDKQPVSRSNFFNFLAAVERYQQETGIDLFKQCFSKITESNKKEMGLDKPGRSGRIKKRMDSLMVPTSAARLPRTGIVYVTNQDAVKLYVSLMGEEIPGGLRHYLDDSDRNAVIYHNKDVQMDKLTQLLTESVQIRDLMREDLWKNFDQYKNLLRCIDDQCTLDESGYNPVPKSNQEIKGNSMQSPKETEATARTKNHKTNVGDVANVCETYNDEGDAQITEADLQQNTHSDADFFSEYTDSRPEAGPETVEEQVTTDGAYPSGDNVEKAAAKGILMTPTSLTGTPTNPLCGDFKLNEDGTAIVNCPNGALPDRQKYNEKSHRIDAWFSKSTCKDCPYHDNCPYKELRKEYKVTISKEMVARADMQAAMSEEDYKQYGRERNAVESIPSIFRRKYGIDHMRTRRQTRRRWKFYSICLAYNGQKHEKFLRRVSKNQRDKCALSYAA